MLSKTALAGEWRAGKAISVEQKPFTRPSSRKTLRADSLIPAALALIYLSLLLYFKAYGGYKPVAIAKPGS